jgi:hypothetical protein
MLRLKSEPINRWIYAKAEYLKCNLKTTPENGKII